MSGLLDQAGLTAGSGLSNGAGLYKWGNFNPFDPTDLDPYLLFDTAAGSMIGTLENPTLDLDPSNQETLDVITATRSSVATRTLPDGSIALAEQDTVRVDYTQGEQLTPTKFQNIGYTDFSSGWSAGTNLVISAGDGLSGNISKTVTLNNPTNQSYYHTITTVENQVYTGGFWIRRLSGTGSIHLYHLFSATGTQTEITSEITSEWSFVSKEFLGRSGGGGILFGLRVYTQGDSVEIAMPQVEEGTTASSFVANTTGSPKFIASATYGPRVPMILVEPSATNKVPYSAEFSNSSWGKYDITVAPAPVSAPDGTMTASHIVKTGSNGHIAKTNVGAANTHTASIWARTVSGSGTCFFNYQSGTPSTVTDQWQRFEVPANTAHMYAVNFRGTSTLTEIYIWGAQLEEGIATSYIPTQNVPVTRAADDLVISGSDFDFYNQSEGTIYVEGVGRGYFDNNTTFALTLGNSSNNSIYQRTPSNSQVLVVVDSNNVQAQMFSATTSTGTLVRRAASFKLNNFKGSQDGVDILPDTSGTIPTIDRLRVGASPTGLNQLNGHIKRLIYWPTHSDNL